MGRIKSVIKVLYYKIKYKNALQWESAFRCKKVAEIKILSGGLKIGKGFSMNPGSYIAVVDNGNVNIGNNVSINRNSIVVSHGSITIGEHCSIGPNVLIYDHDHRFDEKGLRNGYNISPVVIGKNCWIGGGVTILRGTTIGEGCIIGAGCIVKGEIPPHSLVTANRKLTIVSIEDRTDSIDRM